MTTNVQDHPVPTIGFGDRVRMIRRDARIVGRRGGMTQEMFAEATGIPRKRLQSWESGTEPGASNAVEAAQAIERLFGVPMAWTLGAQPTVAYPPLLPHRERRRRHHHAA